MSPFPTSTRRPDLQQQDAAVAEMDRQAAEQDFIQQQQKEQARMQQMQEEQAREAARAQKAALANAKRQGVKVAPDDTGAETIQRHPDGHPVYEAGFVGEPQISDKGGAVAYRDARGQRYDVPFDAIRSEPDQTGETFYSFDVTSQDGQKQTMRQPAGTKPLFRVDPGTGSRIVDVTDPATGSVQPRVVGVDPLVANKAAIEKRKNAAQLAQNDRSGQAKLLQLELEQKDTVLQPVRERLKVAQEAAEKLAKEKITYQQKDGENGGLFEVASLSDGMGTIERRLTKPDEIAKASAWLQTRAATEKALAEAKAVHDPAAAEIQAMKERRAALAIETLKEDNRAQAEIRRMQEAAEKGADVTQADWQTRVHSLVNDERMRKLNTVADLEIAGDPLAPDVAQAAMPESAASINRMMSELWSGTVNAGRDLLNAGITGGNITLEKAIAGSPAMAQRTGQPATTDEARKIAAKSLGITDPASVEVTPNPLGHLELRYGDEEFASYEPDRNRITIMQTAGGLHERAADLIANADKDGVPVYLSNTYPNKAEQPFNAAELRDLLVQGVDAVRAADSQESAESALAQAGLAPNDIRGMVRAGKLSIQDGRMMLDKFHGVEAVNYSRPAIEQELGRVLATSKTAKADWEAGNKAAVINRVLDGVASKATSGAVVDRGVLEQRRQELLAQHVKEGATSKVGGFVKELIMPMVGIGAQAAAFIPQKLAKWTGYETEAGRLSEQQFEDWQKRTGSFVHKMMSRDGVTDSLAELRSWAQTANPGDSPPDDLAAKIAGIAFDGYHELTDDAAKALNTSRDTFNVNRDPMLQAALSRYLTTADPAAFEQLSSLLMMDSQDRKTQAEVSAYISAPRVASAGDVIGRAKSLTIDLTPEQAGKLIGISRVLNRTDDPKAAQHLIAEAGKIMGLSGQEAAETLSRVTADETDDPDSAWGLAKGGFVAGRQELLTEVVSTAAEAGLAWVTAGAATPEIIAERAARQGIKTGIRAAIRRNAQAAFTKLADSSQVFAKTSAALGKARQTVGTGLANMGEAFAKAGIKPATFGQPLTRADKVRNAAVQVGKNAAAAAPMEALEEGVAAIGEPDPNAASIGEQMLMGAAGGLVLTPMFAGAAAVGRMWQNRGAGAEWEKRKAGYIEEFNRRMEVVPNYKPINVEDFNNWQSLQEHPAQAQALTALRAAKDKMVRAAWDANMAETGIKSPEFLAAETEFNQARDVLAESAATTYKIMDELRALPEAERSLYTAAAKAATGARDFTEAEAKALMAQGGNNAVVFQQAQVMPADVAGPPAQRTVGAPTVSNVAPGVYRLPAGVRVDVPPALLDSLVQKAPTMVDLLRQPANQTPAVQAVVAKTDAKKQAMPKAPKGKKAKPATTNATTPTPTKQDAGPLPVGTANTTGTPAQQPANPTPAPVAPTVKKGDWIVDSSGFTGPVIDFANGVPVMGLEGENEGDVQPQAAQGGWEVVSQEPPTPADQFTDASKKVLPAKAIEKVTREAIGRVAAKSPRIKALLRESKKANRYPTGGMWLEPDGSVMYHVPTIIQQLESIGVADTATAGKRVEALLDEEIRHSANMEAARRLYAQSKASNPMLQQHTFEEWRDLWYGDIWNSHFTAEMRQAVQEAYGETLPEADWMRAMEGLRMLDQLRATGSITEAVLLALDAILESLREFLDLVTAGGKKVVEAEIMAIREVLAEYGYEAGTVKPDAKKKPAKPKAQKPEAAQASKPADPAPEMSTSGQNVTNSQAIPPATTQTADVQDQTEAQGQRQGQEVLTPASPETAPAQGAADGGTIENPRYGMRNGIVNEITGKARGGFRVKNSEKVIPANQFSKLYASKEDLPFIYQIDKGDMILFEKDGQTLGGFATGSAGYKTSFDVVGGGVSQSPTVAFVRVITKPADPGFEITEANNPRKADTAPANLNSDAFYDEAERLRKLSKESLPDQPQRAEYLRKEAVMISDYADRIQRSQWEFKPQAPQPVSQETASQPAAKPTEPSREEWQKTYAKFKRALAKAVKAKDYAEIIRQADAFQKHYEADGNGPFPDTWSDWERHKSDAEMQLARQGTATNPLVVPILKPVTPPRPAERVDDAYANAQAATRAALGGLFSAPVRRAIPQLEVPRERFDAIRTAAEAILEANIRTPEAFARFMDDTFPGGKARPYSEAIWDMLGIVDKSLRGSHDWTRIYGDIEQPLPDVQEPAIDETPAIPQTTTDETQSAIRAGDQAPQSLDPSGGSGSGTREPEATRPGYSGNRPDVGERMPDNAQPVGGSGDSGGVRKRPVRNVAPAVQDTAGGLAGESSPSAGGNDPQLPGTGTGMAAPEHTPSRSNYWLADPESIVGGGPKARFARNRKALEILEALQEENRDPTPEELDTLAAYTGWGAFGQELFKGTYERTFPAQGWEEESDWLKNRLGKADWESAQESILNAHYTDPPTVSAMWDMIRRMGFTGGRVLEPSLGTGNFFSLMPRDLMAASQLSGIELDPTTASIAKFLHPQANIRQMGYEESTTGDNFYDLIVGNWPFKKGGPADRRYNHLNASLHDYFFVKAIDQVRPGGLVVGITSAGTMDKKSKAVRSYLASRGELVASFRLPTGAFGKYAGTNVVTDIVILRKRETPLQDISGETWVESVKDDRDRDFFINAYYQTPEGRPNILGKLDFGSGSTYGRASMIVTRSPDYEQVLPSVAQRLPENVMQPWKPGEKKVQYIANTTSFRRQNAIVAQGDELYQVNGENLGLLQDLRAWKTKDQAKRLADAKSLLDLRSLLDGLMDAYRKGEDTTKQRETLLAAYTAHVKAHGPLHKSRMLDLFRKAGDPTAADILNMEEMTEKGPRPRAILTQDIMRKRVVDAKGSIADAYALARNNSLQFSVSDVAEAAGVSVAEAEAYLIEQGQIYRTPQGVWEPADVYLAGNVRQKLREAQAAKAEGIEGMERNIAALESIQPADTPYFEIEVQMGASWIPISDYQDFIGSILQASPDDVEIVKSSSGYNVKLKKSAADSSLARSQWGTEYVHPSAMFGAAMNSTPLKVYSEPDKDGVRHLLAEQTEAANQKRDAIREELVTWLWSDPVRTARLVREYNESMNAVVTPKRDGSHLRLEGLALTLGRGEFDFRQHQRDAVWRFLLDGKGVGAHEVGTGKTFTIAGLAMEGRRLGVLRKPMILAHNANSSAIAADISKAYPSAKVLYLDDLGPQARENAMRQIKLDDWDAVVVPHSLISRFALKRETMMRLVQPQIDQLEAEFIAALDELDNAPDVDFHGEFADVAKALARVKGAHTAKDLMKRKIKIEEDIEKRAQATSKEGAISFEELGIDAIIVDEAHIFKKIPLATRKNFKGLQKEMSGAGFQLQLMTDYLKSINNGKGVFLFTGTPVTNTLNEVFNMMRFVMQDEFTEAQIANFDDWFNSFAQATSDIELTSGGTFEPVERVLSFINIPELARMASRVFDVVRANDMPEFKPRASDDGLTDDPLGRPRRLTVPVIAEMSPDQREHKRNLEQRYREYQALDGKGKMQRKKFGGDVPAIIETDGRKSALDHRVFDPEAADFAGSKLNLMVGKIMEHFREHPKATQMVFQEIGVNDYADRERTVRDGEGNARMDANGKPLKEKFRVPTFNLLRDMVEKLVTQGVRPEEIAVFHNMSLDPIAERPNDVLRKVRRISAATPKEELAAMMNRGEIRVAFGSTQTMGTGVNAQEWLRAMHHLDAPWTPGEFEQRNGRGWRQGNRWNTVMEYRYFTEESHDGKMWQTLLNKVRFIERFTSMLQGKGTVARVLEGEGADTSEDGSVSDFEQSFSSAAGDPRLLVRAKLEKEVQKLQRRRQVFVNSIANSRDKIRDLDRWQERDAANLPKFEQDHAAFLAAKEPFSITINGQSYTERKDATDALERLPRYTTRQRIGEFGPFGIYAESTFAGTKFEVTGPSGYTYNFEKPSMQSLEATLGFLKRRSNGLREDMAKREQERAALQDSLSKPWSREADLAAKEKALAQIQLEITASPTPAPSWLRHGAPTGSLIYVRNQDGGLDALDVAAHRWDANDYWILVDNGTDLVPVRYNEALTETGSRLFQDYEFQSPGVQPAAETRPDAGAVDMFTQDQWLNVIDQEEGHSLSSAPAPTMPRDRAEAIVRNLTGKEQAGKLNPRERSALEEARRSLGAPLASAPVRSVTAQDAEYMAAVKAGDMEKAQRMVDEIADSSVEDAFNFHYTGFIGSRVYSDYEKAGGLGWLGKPEKYPVLLASVDGIEYRQTGLKNKYTKVDKNGDIVRDESGIALSMTDEEIAAERLPQFEETTVAFDKDVPIGFSSNEFGAVGVWVEAAYQKRGIGTRLLDMHMKQRPNAQIGQMTNAGINMTRSYLRKKQNRSPVLRNSSGNVIPLSQRFNPQSENILYSAPAPKKPNRATQAMRDIIESLPPPHREVLRDLLLNGMTPEDAAKAHNLSETAIGNILRRGEAHIRLMLEHAPTKPTVQVQDGIVKATDGRPDLAMSGNAAVAAVDQRRMTPEEVTHAEMQELATRLFDVAPAEAESLVVRWMDSGTTVLSTDGMPDSIKAIVADAQARNAAEMLMTAAAKMLVARKTLEGGNSTQLARLIYLYRNTGTEQARALGMRRDPFDTPEERAAMYLSEALLTPPDAIKNELRRNPANRDRILAAWAKRADEIKAEMLAHGIDLDATFADHAEEQKLVEETIPEPVKPALARAPKKTRQLVKAIMQGMTPAEAIRAAGMTAKAAFKAYQDFRAALNQSGTDAAKAMQDQLLRSAPAPGADFAANLGLPNLTEQEWLDAVEGNRPIRTTPETEKLKQHREKAKKAGTLDLKNSNSTRKAIRAIEERKSNAFEKLSEFWRASILSGPQTHVVNLVSGLTYGAYEASFKKLAAGVQGDIARMFGAKPDAASLADIPAMIAASLPSIKLAFLDGIAAWKSETRAFENYALQLRDDNGELFKEQFNPALKGTLGKVMRGISFRLMGAADEFVKSFFTRIEVAAQARQIARNEGKTGHELAKAIQELMEPGSLAWERALGQAKKITFQTEIGSGSAAIDAIDGLAQLISRTKKGDFGKPLKGLAHFTFPFVDTPTNIFKAGVTMSPVGGLLALVDMIRAYNRYRKGNAEEAAKIYNAARALDDLTNQIVAWGFILGLSHLVKPGDDEDETPFITGTIPWRSTSPGERELSYRTAPPQSIRIGDRWISYKRLDPFASALAFTVDAIREFQSGKPIDEVWTKIGLGMMRNMQDKTFLQGISDVVNAVQDPERFGTKWATNIATGFIPNLIRQPIRTADDVFRETDLPNDLGFWDALGRRMGYGVYPQGAMPSITVWGEAASKDTGAGGPNTDWMLRLLSPADMRAANVDMLDVALLRYNATHQDGDSRALFGVTAPSRELQRTIGGHVIKISLDDAEYEDFITKAGKAARQAIGNTYEGRDLTEQDVDRIKDILARAHETFRNAAFVQAVQKRGGLNALANTSK